MSYIWLAMLAGLIGYVWGYYGSRRDSKLREDKLLSKLLKELSEATRWRAS